jgi:hypothetical protein
METQMRLIALASSLLLAVAPLASVAQDGPRIIEPDQIGQIFCIARLGNDMAPVEALLTPGLAGAIDEALYRDGEIAAMNPDEKPPLGDGIPWQSWPDYAPECTVARSSYEMDEARVWIDYGFSEAPDASFTDVLQLKLIEGPLGWNVWRIDNVSYAVDSDLRTALVSVFMD